MAILILFFLISSFRQAWATPSSGIYPIPSFKHVLLKKEPNFSGAFREKKKLLLAAQRALDYLAQLPPGASFRIAGRSYKAAWLAVSAQEFLDLLKEARSSKELAGLIRQNFDLFESQGSNGKGRVIFSDYYEPVLPARFKRDPIYRYPLYRQPTEKKLSALSREEIDAHQALAGKGLEIAWLKDPFDAFDLQVQGSGILRFPGGVDVLAQYAATNGLPYRAVGTALVKAGVFKKGEITKDKLRAYLKKHPKIVNKILDQDPRYVFFKLESFHSGEEPRGTSGEALVPGVSIAVDPAVIPMGALAYIDTISPRADAHGHFLGQFKRHSFAFCLDTGGAIKGPGRIDIYVGHGDVANTVSANQWSDGKLFILIKKK